MVLHMLYSERGGRILSPLDDSEREFYHNESCLPTQFGRGSDFLVNFGIFSSIFTLLIVLSGIMLWYMNKDALALKRRDPKIVFFLIMPLFCNLCCGAFFRIQINNPDSIFLQCHVLNITFLMVLPCVLVPNMVRMLLHSNRCRYSRLKAQTLEHYMNPTSNHNLTPTKPGSGRLASDSTNTTTSVFEQRLKRLGRQCTTSFGLQITVFALTVSFFICFLFALLNCPLAGTALKRCDFANLTDLISLIFIVPCIMLLIVYFYQLYYVREEPDPFLIRRELFYNNVFGAFIGIPSIGLSVLNPGDLQNDDGTLGFRWAYFLDFSLLLMFLNSVHAQVILARLPKFKKVSVSLKDILISPTGCKLFESFLVGEYSVENLTFYKTVNLWKEKYGTTDTGVRSKEARNIFKRYIKEGALGQVNISASLRESMREIFEGSNPEEDVSIDVFESVQAEVFRLMESDSFSRFVFTKLYKEFLGLVEPGESKHKNNTMTRVRRVSLAAVDI